MSIPDIHIPITVEVTPEIIIELLIKLHILENIIDGKREVQTEIVDNVILTDKETDKTNIPDMYFPITVEVVPEIKIDLLVKLHIRENDTDDEHQIQTEIINNDTDDEQWIQTKVIDKMNIGDKKPLVAGKMILQYEKLNSISNLQE